MKQRNFFELLLLGYKNYWEGIKIIIRYNLYWFVAFPLVLFIGVYWLGSFFKSVEIAAINNLVQNYTEITTLNGLIFYSSKLIFFDLLHVVFTKFTLYIVVVILAPVLSILSERIEHILTGNKYPFRLKQVLNDVQRGARIAFRNITWEYFFIVLVLGLASLFDETVRAIVIFSIPMVFGFYFYGFSFMDYVNERRRLNIQQSVYFVSQHKGLAMAIGSIYSIFFLSFHLVLRKFDTLSIDTSTQLFWGTILVLTFILAVIAPIIAIASATISMHEIVDLSKNPHAIKHNELQQDTKNELIEEA